jgi:hypothetical protein
MMRDSYVERERLNQLLGNPGAGGVRRDIEMNDISSVVLEDQQDVQQPECSRGVGEEIDGGKVFFVSDILDNLLTETLQPHFTQNDGVWCVEA